MELELLAKTELFHGCSEAEIAEMVVCLGISQKSYTRGEIILAADTRTTGLGMVLSGSVRIENNDAWGNKSILGITGPGGVFAEAYACAPDGPMPVDAVANEACSILFLDVSRIFTPCRSICGRHVQLIRNLLRISARKNQALSRRIFYTTPKTIRERLMSFFSDEISRAGSAEFELNMDRQQLADYLNVDRSALSKELAKMKAEGLLEYRKNRFRVNMPDV